MPTLKFKPITFGAVKEYMIASYGRLPWGNSADMQFDDLNPRDALSYRS